ncbi:hypothetical protein D3C73_1471240 [compost metagenome]
MNTKSAPFSISNSDLFLFLVVEIIVAPILFPSCAAANPTELVPPRISKVSPLAKLRTSKSEV